MSTDATPPPPPPADDRLPRNVRVLGWVSLLNDTASEMIAPLVPEFVMGTLGAGPRFLGLMEGARELISGLLKLASGYLSDRGGERKAWIVGGYLTSALLRPLSALVTAPWQLFTLRFLDRVGKGARIAPRDALIVRSTPPERRGAAFGFQRAMDHLGAAIGPLWAALMLAAGFDVRTVFAVTLLPGLAAAAVVIFGLREAHVDAEPPRADVAAKPVHRAPGFRVYLAALLLFTLGNSSDLFLLARTHELGVSTAWNATLWCVFHLLKSAGNTWFGRRADRTSPRGMLQLGWLWYALIYALLGWATTAWQGVVLFLAYAMYYAMSEPSEKLIVARLTGGARGGAAFGWYYFILGAAQLPASWLFGALYQSYGAATAFMFGATLAVAACAVITFVRVPHSQRDEN